MALSHIIISMFGAKIRSDSNRPIYYVDIRVDCGTDFKMDSQNKFSWYIYVTKNAIKIYFNSHGWPSNTLWLK